MRASISSLSAVVGLLKLAAGAVFPEPPTTFQVTWESLELIDQDRMDPYNKTHPRRLMISKFSPVPRSACLETCRVKLMSETVGSVEDELLATYIDAVSGGDTKWPKGVLASTEIEVCCKVKEDRDGDGHNQEKVPTVLFGPGLSATRLFYSGVAQHLAGIGYEVIVMDHPYESNIVEFPDGTVIIGVPIDPTNNESVNFALDVRAADASFVLDTLGFAATDKVIHIGQSFGGAATATAMAKDGRIAGGVNLDGGMFGPVLSEGVTRPFLIWGTVGHNSTTLPSWDEFIKSTRSRGAWVKQLGLEDSLHFTFVDFSILADVNGLRSNERLTEIFFAAMTGSRAMEILREYLSDFIEFALGRRGEGVLEGPNKQFPEVTFPQVLL
jgi:pimeloyl-ACP methyl ester carboxylesterase